MRHARVIVFAKAPVPGTVKTRLAPRLGDAGAAALHTRLVERTLETALAAGLGTVELCCAPDGAHPFFKASAERFGVTLTAQGEGDLGARMHRALARSVGEGKVILIGTDCPVMDAGYLRAADAALDEAALVVGPAEDGGYVLVGARDGIDARVFRAIEWGGPEVLAATRDRAMEIGVRYAEIATLWDVDVPGDYERWRSLAGDTG
jgi:rSAM/selenodomain-associated transferase 1